MPVLPERSRMPSKPESSPSPSFAPVPELIAAVARGEMVIVVDDQSRENEGDFILAAELATPETIGQMATRGRGLICVPMDPEWIDRLELPQMVDGSGAELGDPYSCAFTISVDARDGITTGISAFDRARTARLLADAKTEPRELRRPGHMFPLRARPGGVLERAGHTEAAVDLARFAGLSPVGVICEILNDDGTMARRDDLFVLAREHGYKVGSVADLIAYRESLSQDSPDAVPPSTKGCPLVRHLSAARLPTPLGVFNLHVFANEQGQEIVALATEKLERPVPAGSSGPPRRPSRPPLVRMHSACFTGDILGSLRCDCGGQLRLALERLGEDESGMLIYLPQEGRGIGLASKIEAYALQEHGLDTVEANRKLGFAPDLRDYGDAAAILRWFGFDQVRLLTNNPAKIAGLVSYGVEVAERVAIEPGPGPVNLGYLRAKKDKLGHFFEAM